MSCRSPGFEEAEFGWRFRAAFGTFVAAAERVLVAAVAAVAVGAVPAVAGDAAAVAAVAAVALVAAAELRWEFRAFADALPAPCRTEDSAC